MTTEEFKDWYNDLPLLIYGEISDKQVCSAFKQILTWKSEGRFISGQGSGKENDIPDSEHNFTTTEYWLYLGLLSECIDYGSSPRGAWLTNKGKEILDFLNNNKNIEEIIEN